MRLTQTLRKRSPDPSRIERRIEGVATSDITLAIRGATGVGFSHSGHSGSWGSRKSRRAEKVGEQDY